MPDLKITVNGDPLDVAEGTTIAAFLSERKIEPRLVVVEYNREIIDRDRYGETVLLAGDVIEIVKIVGGG